MAKHATKKVSSAQTGKKTLAQAPASNPEQWMPWVAAGLAFLLFSTGFSNPMVAMEDQSVTVDNPAVNDFSLAIFGQFHLGVYTPLTWIGYALAHALSKNTALWYHLFSAAVHAANAFLVFRLFRRLEGSSTVAFVIALLFAVHPLQVEAVSWIAAFGVPLCALFSLLALNAWLRHSESPAWSRNYWLALGFFALACLSKPTAIALPLTLLAVDLWLKRPPFSRASMLEKAPFFGLALGFGLLAWYAQAARPADVVGDAYSIADRVLMACHTILFYWIKIIAPIGLSIWYPFYKTAGGGWHWTYYAAPVALLGLLALVWRMRERWPFVFRGVLFYLANVVFTLPLFAIGSAEVRTDRFNYLAILGVLAILAALPRYLQEKNSSRVGNAWALVAILGVAWLLISAARIRDWRDTINLIDKSVAAQGDNFGKAYLWRGMAYGDKGEGRQALSDFSRALNINPNLTEAYKYRGGLLGFAKQYDQSVADLSKYLDVHPNDADILYNRALSLVNLNRFQEALSDLNKALEADPNFVRAYRARGNVRKQLGDTAGADTDLQEFERRNGK